jgi:hypothetical protein
VGNAGFSSGSAGDPRLAFSPSGQPYVAYIDPGYGDAMTVMKFDGTNWVNVGNEGFSGYLDGYPSLAFGPSDGLPYVAYQDGGYSMNVTVMKFDGTNWVNVGNAGFSSNGAEYISIAFSPSDGQPYVAYSDVVNSYKATVMKYDSVFVGIDEPQKSRLLIYPNPATDKITIEISGIAIKSQLSIMNLNGQEVIIRQITEPKTQINISNMPSGVYFVRVTNDKTVEIGKMIKQ